MKLDQAAAERLVFLRRVVGREKQYLLEVDGRLFSQLDAFKAAVAGNKADPVFTERLDAFVSRFSRLQDTLGDKLLPALLAALAEAPASTIENLDRAERLGLLESADAWLEIRKLRNLMVHEYIEDPELLTNALWAGHAFVPALCATADRMTERLARLGLP